MSPQDPNAFDASPRRWRLFKFWCGHYLWVLRRKLPYLVWHGEEIDVRVNFPKFTLQDHGLNESFSAFLEAAPGELRRQFHALGIEFDSGIGFDGYDWEWDSSLRGPISVTFMSRAAKPERRKERPRPTLVVNNTAA